MLQDFDPHRGTTFAAGRSGALRAAARNCNRRIATTDNKPATASHRSLVWYCRSSMRQPVLKACMKRSIIDRFS